MPKYRDEDEVLADGQSLRVPLVMMDSVQRGIAQLDASGWPVGQRPGYVGVADAAALRDREVAFADMEKRLCDAWKSPARRAQESEPDAVVDPAKAAEAARKAYIDYLENAWRSDFNPFPTAAAAPNNEVAERLRSDFRWRVSHL